MAEQLRERRLDQSRLGDSILRERKKNVHTHADRDADGDAGRDAHVFFFNNPSAIAVQHANEQRPHAGVMASMDIDSTPPGGSTSPNQQPSTSPPSAADAASLSTAAAQLSFRRWVFYHAALVWWENGRRERLALTWSFLRTKGNELRERVR